MVMGILCPWEVVLQMNRGVYFCGS